MRKVSSIADVQIVLNELLNFKAQIENGKLNQKMNQLKNVGDGSDLSDAATLGQIQQLIGSEIKKAINNLVLPKSIDNTIQFAAASSNLTLNDSATNVPGCTITITDPGNYLIIGSWDFADSGVSDVGCLYRGLLYLNGSNVGSVAKIEDAVAVFRATVTTCWNQLLASGDIITLRAMKTSGTGTSTATTSSYMMAIKITDR